MKYFSPSCRDLFCAVVVSIWVLPLLSGERTDAFVRGEPVSRPVPRPAMAERLATDVDVIGIAHWGLNTYTDREWGYGDEDPALLNPSAFDADQIVSACKAGGLKGLVVVAKHHDGFCLWPTKTTEHNITKTPFWRGTGNGERGTGRDYVKEMEQACRRHGLKFGVYCSPWDRNSAHYATDKYVEIYHAQLKELLGGAYGDVFEMWFDGANGGDGYYGGAREKRRIGEDYYRFDEIFRFVRELQPKVTIFSGAHDDSDIRWCGNERGYVCDDSRATVVRTGGFCDWKFGNPDYVPTRNEGSPDGEFFRVNEADFPLRRGWFYHEGERGTTKSGAYLAKLYVGTVGNGGTMDIGVAPNKDGVLDADDVKALKDFDTFRRALFANEAKDGEKFNVVVMREDLSQGELVDEWEFVTDGKAILRGKSIGNKRIRLLKEPAAANGCEVRVLRGVGTPKVSYALYCADQSVIDAILDAKGDDGETDTAKWMTTGASARREFFVSPDGNDASDGSATHPWRTINHAAAVAQAGDTVTIREGIYREWVKPANAGREGAPITYRAAQGERVVVTGADEVRCWAIEDCDISCCFRDKKFFGYEMAGIKIHAAVGMTIRRNRIHDNGCFGVWLDWMAQGTRLSGNVFWDNDQHDVFLEVVHGPILLEGNDFLSRQAVQFKGSNNIALVGNRIFGSLACDDDASLGYRKTPVFHPHSTRIKELYADCVPANLVFINNIMPEVPRFPDLATNPCRCEDNFFVPREYWGINAQTGDVGIAPPPSLPRPDFKPVGAERLGTGLFTGEDFPMPDAKLAIPEWGMRI